ncbi:mediator of RNA polymerase II transcription subunit 19 [Yarrowia lipolytica]|uniref:Mediator of RNA polymerase II transcription subunit 19 n=1 Tax=Yarrowia lipolytica TaxID=4952 RepID=A0A1D8NHW8_YARLL|nr:hypothetical protein YALI1_E13034g [Yarrowia lipolytica]KAB8280693.1 mediator of RNA polymerase II transcription subunit 19 [Yarrowia lipolytica]KAE8173386.1 mediator of RNA polymerase II transcription subunit 19 [Yarrowia lipolytica]KAJ8056753.1 mediator of RNA polymerase II transcription subunit 19 [Yarrowia lipolytica]RMI98399.1 mediator of RNA polymerase II transcription subunit 19 [Yarrowia lipolytica]
MPNYYLADDTKYTRPSTSAMSNLTELCGLKGLADSMARFDPVTGEKNKLRKSYKNQLLDLTGKFDIPSQPSLVRIIRDPVLAETGGKSLSVFDRDLLSRGLDFDATPSTGIPGFNPAMLGMPGPGKPGIGPQVGGNRLLSVRKSYNTESARESSNNEETPMARRKRKGDDDTDGERRRKRK